MVAQNEPPVSPTQHGTEQAIDAAAWALADEIRAYAKAHPEHGIPAGQRLLAGQHLAHATLTALLVGVHFELDDIFGPAGKTHIERKRDVLMAQLTTYFLPALLEASADAASFRTRGQDPDAVREAVFADVDMLFDLAILRGDNAADDATRDA
jgi:hypothetical protein